MKKRQVWRKITVVLAALLAAALLGGALLAGPAGAASSQGLGDLSGGIFQSVAYGVSADGSVVVGMSYFSGDYGPFIWDATNGMQTLQELLISCGLGDDLTDWTLTKAYGISGDGLTIVGEGINPSGHREAWRAVVPVP